MLCTRWQVRVSYGVFDTYSCLHDIYRYLQALMRGKHVLLASACILGFLAHGARAHISRHQNSSSTSVLILARNHSCVSTVIMLRARLVIFECTCALTQARNHSSVSTVIMLRTMPAIFECTCALTLARSHSSVSAVILLRAKLGIFELTCVPTQTRNHSCVGFVIMLRMMLIIFEDTCALTQATSRMRASIVRIVPLIQAA